MSPAFTEHPVTESPGTLDGIVVIDDDYAIRLSCRQTLTKVGYRVEVFEDGARGLEGVAALRPALVVVDLKMPGISGLQVISRVHEIDPDIVLIVITGYATIGTAIEAMKAGAYDFLPKPFKPDELRMIVRRGLEHRHLILESQRCERERELLQRRIINFVSHQLKSPLVAVHQYLDVMKRMQDAPGSAGQREAWLTRCLERTTEMTQLIEDWLTLARIGSGASSRKREAVDLKEIVGDALKGCEELAAATGVALSQNMPDAAYPVTADRTAMRALFDNLIVNAIKYNRPDGSVTVRAERVAGEIAVAVIDTGIGIPEKDRPFVFDEFYRVESEGGTRTRGSGLGLPICRSIVAGHGGRIDFESTVGSGTTFRVYLVERPPAADRDAEPSAAG